MNARILCPGPSLAQYPPDDFAGLTLSVNRAVLHARCDIWVACDYLLINQVAPLVPGRPSLLTSGDSVRHIQPPWRGFWTFESLRDSVVPGTPAAWPRYSFTAAVVCAAARGATSIECHGVDWQGELDYDGVAGGTHRSDERWEDERRIAAALFDALGKAGVSVTRAQSA